MTTTSTEGNHRCGSCLQWVGTAFDGLTRPYRRWVDSSGEHIFCADRMACDRRWRAIEDAEDGEEEDTPWD